MTLKCIKCQKLGPLFTCNGCQQTFCDQHVSEHREELGEKMNVIERDSQHFEEGLNENTLMQTYLARIGQWEQESIRKIQKTAELARNDLSQILERMKNQFRSSLEQINQDIQVNRDLKTFTETNLNQWTEQLKQLREFYTDSFTDEIFREDHSSIPLIKIIDRKRSFTLDQFSSPSPPLPHDKFEQIVGAITLSKDHLTATCKDRNWNGSTISGTNLYSSGVHTVRFRITKKGKNNLFFGITSSLQAVNPYNRKTPFAYGWWQIPLDEKEKCPSEDVDMKTGDEVTLTLDCIYNQLQFEHHRTKRYVDETISDEQCPLPWKIALVLYSPGDSVTIL